MEAISRSPAGPYLVAGLGEEPLVPVQQYSVRAGDTLSTIATSLQKLGVPGLSPDITRQLVSLNRDVPDWTRLQVGQVLHVPAPPSPEVRHSPWRPAGTWVEEYAPRCSRMDPFSFAAGPGPVAPEVSAETPARTHAKAAGTEEAEGVRSREGLTFPSSRGVPRFRQNPRSAEEGTWGHLALNESLRGKARSTVAEKGCALTCAAMALSKMTGEVLTPGQLDAHLDAREGYVGNSLRWDLAGGITGGRVEVQRHPKGVWNLGRIDAELAAERPVVIGLHYKPGGDESRGGGGTDHWVCLTHREGEVYYANDPATGEVVRFRKGEQGELIELPDDTGRYTHGAVAYRSSRQMVTFRSAPSARAPQAGRLVSA